MLEISNKIKQARKSKGLNQQGLATLLGKTQGLIGHWENGKREIKRKDLEKIAKITGKPISWFFQDEESRETESGFKGKSGIVPGQDTGSRADSATMESSVIERMISMEKNSKAIEETIIRQADALEKQNTILEKLLNLQTENNARLEKVEKKSELLLALEAGEITAEETQRRMRKINVDNSKV